MKNYKYQLNGLDCAACAQKVEDKIKQTPKYQKVVVNFSTSKLTFQTEQETNPNETTKEINKLIQKVEPDVTATIEGAKTPTEQKTERANTDILRIIIGILIYYISTQNTFIQQTLNINQTQTQTIQIILLILSLLILLIKIIPKAYKQLIKNHVLDENILITISVIGACIVNKQTEGIMVITLYEIGKILEAKAVSKTRKSITELMDIKPEYANLKTENGTKQVNPEEIKIGDIIIIKTGEKIPLDGKIIKGKAQINNQALTGESIPIQVQENSQVLSGGINIQGLIEVQVEKTYENSTVNQILNLVENATDKKAKTENFVAKAAKIYTPIVIALAILVAILMPIITKTTYSESIYKALIFLVISCPCSIAISVPLSYFTGIGKASKKGILIKGSDYLDNIKDIKQIIFDKTGTLTTGNFQISNITQINEKYTKEEILKYFALGESYSNHPIAKAIISKIENKKDLNTKNIQNLKEIPGKGITYEIEGKQIKIGNQEFAGIQQKEETNTKIYLKINDETIGEITLEDEIKPKAKETIEKLKQQGIKTKMYTGDKKQIAEKIANEIGIQETKSQMLPQDKYKELENQLNQKPSNEKIAYVGDGINDSPVLARADIGISMGGIGQSSAIEASDIVIMTDELSKIIEAIQISKRTNQIIKQNLIFSIGIKILTMILSIYGITDMWQAVFADVGTTLITILNTIRILK